MAETIQVPERGFRKFRHGFVDALRRGVEYAIQHPIRTIGSIVVGTTLLGVEVVGNTIVFPMNLIAISKGLGGLMLARTAYRPAPQPAAA